MPRDPPARPPPHVPKGRELREALPHVGEVLLEGYSEGGRWRRVGREEVEAEDRDGRGRGGRDEEGVDVEGVGEGHDAGYMDEVGAAGGDEVRRRPDGDGLRGREGEDGGLILEMWRPEGDGRAGGSDTGDFTLFRVRIPRSRRAGRCAQHVGRELDHGERRLKIGARNGDMDRARRLRHILLEHLVPSCKKENAISKLKRREEGKSGAPFISSLDMVPNRQMTTLHSRSVASAMLLTIAKTTLTLVYSVATAAGHLTSFGDIFHSSPFSSMHVATSHSRFGCPSTGMEV